jgi:DNA-binding transcriptional ArsR family regulator
MSLEVDQGPRDSRAELRALAHPTRLQIMSLLTGAAMTAADVARELDLTHANASYHLRQLHAVGAIEAAGEERIRGGVAKRYRYNPDHMPGRGGLHLADRRAVFLAVAAELRRRAGALRFTEGRNHMTDAELWVHPATWEDFRSRVQEASVALHKAALPPRTPGTIRTNASIALFEMEPDAR